MPGTLLISIFDVHVLMLMSFPGERKIASGSLRVAASSRLPKPTVRARRGVIPEVAAGVAPWLGNPPSTELFFGNMI